MVKGLIIFVSMLLPCSGLVAPTGISVVENNANVRGKVFSSGFGTAVQGATITFRGSVHQRSAVSDSDGSYLIEHLPEGHYNVTATCQGFEIYHAEATLGPGWARVNVAIDVGLQGDSNVGFLIEGTICGPDKRPLDGAELFAKSPFDKNFVERVTTQADGRYRIEIPRPGQYVLYASKERYTVVAQVVVARGERTRADFTLPVFHF